MSVIKEKVSKTEEGGGGYSRKLPNHQMNVGGIRHLFKAKASLSCYGSISLIRHASRSSSGGFLE